MKALLSAAVAAALLVVACAESSAPLEAPQPGAPCGNAGVVCFGSDMKATGMCCFQGSVCGGGFPNVGCPAGQCCYEGTDGMSYDDIRPAPVLPAPRPQWMAR